MSKNIAEMNDQNFKSSNELNQLQNLLKEQLASLKNQFHTLKAIQEGLMQEENEARKLEKLSQLAVYYNDIKAKKEEVENLKSQIEQFINYEDHNMLEETDPKLMGENEEKSLEDLD